MKIRYTFSQKEDLDYLHECTLDVLKNVGVVFSSEKALEIFKKNGFRVDGTIVFFEEEDINKALKTTPDSFEWKGRKSSVIVGDGRSLNAPAYGPIYVSKRGKIESATISDYVNFHKLHESSSVIDAGNPNVLEPFEVSKELRAQYMMASTLMYSTKPILGLSSGEINSEISINMAKKFYGISDDQCVVVGLINAAAPMHFSTDMSEALITYASNNQAVIITAGGMSCMTTPPTIAGTLLTSNAAVLAGIVLAQLVRQGSPIIYGIPSSGCDLRFSVPTCGSSEAALFVLANREIGNYYGLPVRAGGILSDSKTNDYQLGYESMLMSLTTYMSKIDFILHACGILDTYNTISYEKYILDEELIEITNHFLAGFELSDKTMCVDEIKAKGPVGNFLGRTNKLYLNDYFLPKFVNRESNQNWMKKDKKELDEVAQEEYQKRINEFKLTNFSDDQKRILNESIPKELQFDSYSI